MQNQIEIAALRTAIEDQVTLVSSSVASAEPEPTLGGDDLGSMADPGPELTHQLLADGAEAIWETGDQASHEFVGSAKKCDSCGRSRRRHP